MTFISHPPGTESDDRSVVDRLQLSTVTGPKPRPTGRAEVQAAVLQAAGEHFARHGTSASLRAIADEANVNLGLIHRHFGNKDDLLRAVLRQQTQAGAALVAREPTPAAALHDIFAAGPSTARYVRTLAWLLLEGTEPASFQSEYPTITALRAMAHDHLSDGDYDLRLLAGLLVVYGWTVFGTTSPDQRRIPSTERATATSGHRDPLVASPR
jgi:AcrR family transcriptional regulator